MKKYIPSFGVEIHAELLTKTKAFSPAKVDFNAKPNTMVHPIDIGYPGVKPLVNEKIVEHGFVLAKALRMHIDDLIQFDRKNYFYPDLGKGFQITQFYHPIGKNGYLEVFDKNGKTKKILVRQIHLEEDTAKQIHLAPGKVGFDFNRAGVGLVEIVSDFKQFETIQDVLNYIEQMRQLLIQLDVCDGRMENGSFRVDINVSIREEGSDKYGTRVEIKNINSLNFVQKALESEIKIQEDTLRHGHQVEMTTKRFDEKEMTVKLMRKKNSEQEYNYFVEGNINPIKLSEMVKKQLNLKFEAKTNPAILRHDLTKIFEQDKIDQIFQNKALASMFMELNHLLNKPQEVFNFLFNTSWTDGVIREDGVIKKFTVDASHLVRVIKLLNENKITKTDVTKIFENTAELDLKLEKFEKVVQMSEHEIESIFKHILSSNPTILNKENVEASSRKIMGEFMKLSKGKANAKTAMEILNSLINK